MEQKRNNTPEHIMQSAWRESFDASGAEEDSRSIYKGPSEEPASQEEIEEIIKPWGY